ncbi:nucleotide pyrophosphohydrolase [Patescibacteria group bacterium]
MPQLTIKQTQKLVDQWIKKYGVRYFSELTNLGLLTEEVGEVARVMTRKYGEQSAKKSDEECDLGEELADVLFIVICIANQAGIDLTKALAENFEKKTKRDKDRHHKNAKLKKEAL